MPTLYVTEPGAVVRRSDAALVVTVHRENDGDKPRQEVLAKLQPHRLEAIGLMGRSHLTTDAALLCLERGISVSWFGRGGQLKGRLVPTSSQTADLRLAQYALAQDPQGSLDLCRSLISAKIRNGAAVLSALRSNRPAQPALGEAIKYLRRASDRAAGMDAKETLIGVEGDAARAYFQGIAQCFDGDITFETRLRRPPPDPANALLSFGYVLLANRIAGLLEANGLDPYVGLLHSTRSGRPSLALDLLEELRYPVVDRFVLRACNRRELRPEHFERDERRAGGVRLTRDGARLFFTAWERHLRSPLPGAPDTIAPQGILTQQASLLTAHIRHGESYTPFLLPPKP